MSFLSDMTRKIQGKETKDERRARKEAQEAVRLANTPPPIPAELVNELAMSDEMRRRRRRAGRQSTLLTGELDMIPFGQIGKVQLLGG